VDQSQPTPFDVRYTLDGEVRFTDPDGFPAVKPPWGTLTAIDMNRAAIAWQVPLGEIPGSGLADTGSENYGGPVVTASGLVFIGATIHDRRFRAFEARTGRKLWETTLPAAGNATPAVYEVGGKQFVVIAAGGGKWGAPSGGSYVAFALP
jgi:quinoprotein glucose dehydrogenase